MEQISKEQEKNSLDASALAETFSPSVQAGIQFRFMGDEKEKFAITDDGKLSGEYNRIWFFVRGDLRTKSLFQEKIYQFYKS